MREGGCWPFVERGGMLAVHREREVAICSEREEATVCCGGREGQRISTLLRNLKFNDVRVSILEVVHTAFKVSISEKDEPFRKFLA